MYRHSKTLRKICYNYNVSCQHSLKNLWKVIFHQRWLSNGTVQNHFGTKRSVATLFRFVAHFTRVWIEDCNRNRFELNGIKKIACFIVFFRARTFGRGTICRVTLHRKKNVSCS